MPSNVDMFGLCVIILNNSKWFRLHFALQNYYKFFTYARDKDKKFYGKTRAGLRMSKKSSIFAADLDCTNMCAHERQTIAT